MAKEYPELYKQIEEVRLKLASKIAAGLVLEVPVSQYAAFVDAENSVILSRSWRVAKSRNSFYAYTRIEGKDAAMHRLIQGLTDPRVLVDHWDFCGLNNTYDNMRVVTAQQNNANRRKSFKTKTTSIYKGVSLKTTGVPADRPWVANIRVSGDDYKRRRVSLGYYATPEEAALAYNVAAIKYFGEYAHLNEICAVPCINP